MHKRLVNECLIDLEITTEGPLLIKSGQPGLEGPDMAPIVTYRQRPFPEPFIPGSSLKGVIRSYAERIARTVCNQPDHWRVGACNPFSTEGSAWTQVDGACASKFARRKDQKGTHDTLTSASIYRDACPICKLFGTTYLLGRLAVPDAYLPEDAAYQKEMRDGVGIDRFTGGAAHGAKFDLEVVTQATFQTCLHLHNFELWQLGLLACVLHDLNAGLIAIGSGKSRGLGRVRGVVKTLELKFPTRLCPVSSTTSIWGLSALEPEAEQTAYGYWPGEMHGVAMETLTVASDALGLRTVYRLDTPELIGQLWQHVAPIAMDYLEQYEIPQMMRLRTGTE